MGVMVLFVLWVVQDSYHHRMFGIRQLRVDTWDFPRIRVPYFGVLVIRILLFRVYWGPLFWGNPPK